MPILLTFKADQHPTFLALVHLHDSSLLCVYPMFFVDVFLLLQTFPFSRASPTHAFSAHISASHAAGGEPPLPMHSGATHPCTNSAARAAGGESPPLRAHLGDPHPAQVPQLERPRRAHPPVPVSHAQCDTRLQHPCLLRVTMASF